MGERSTGEGRRQTNFCHRNGEHAALKRIFSQVFCHRVRIGRSRSSKVIDFGTNRKRVCDFLLVIHSNLGPILNRFCLIYGDLLDEKLHIFLPLSHSALPLPMFPLEVRSEVNHIDNTVIINSKQ